MSTETQTPTAEQAAKIEEAKKVLAEEEQKEIIAKTQAVDAILGGTHALVIDQVIQSGQIVHQLIRIAKIRK